MKFMLVVGDCHAMLLSDTGGILGTLAFKDEESLPLATALISKCVRSACEQNCCT